jgi:hypothetical protein
MDPEIIRKKLVEITEYYYAKGLITKEGRNEILSKLSIADPETLKLTLLILNELLQDIKEDCLARLKIVQEIESMLKEVFDYAY